MTIRCQKGIVRSIRRGRGVSSVERQRTTAGEAVLDAMPPGDLVLVDLPAEQHRLAAAPCGEVDESRVEILHLRAMARDLVDELCQLPRDVVDLRSGRG